MALPFSKTFWKHIILVYTITANGWLGIRFHYQNNIKRYMGHVFPVYRGFERNRHHRYEPDWLLEKRTLQLASWFTLTACCVPNVYFKRAAEMLKASGLIFNTTT